MSSNIRYDERITNELSKSVDGEYRHYYDYLDIDMNEPEKYDIICYIDDKLHKLDTELDEAKNKLKNVVYQTVGAFTQSVLSSKYKRLRWQRSNLLKIREYLLETSECVDFIVTDDSEGVSVYTIQNEEIQYGILKYRKGECPEKGFPNKCEFYIDNSNPVPVYKIELYKLTVDSDKVMEVPKGYVIMATSADDNCHEIVPITVIDGQLMMIKNAVHKLTTGALIIDPNTKDLSFTDEWYICKDCGKPFWMSWLRSQDFLNKGLCVPKRCHSCIEKRRDERRK